MKILSAIILAILFLIISPFFIVFFGAAEVYKLYEEVLRNVEKHLDETGGDNNVQENAGN
ncbi:MAG: hypothetical protein II304_06775 [Bacteroidales bacterium]|nr:hypothetical protein [Bacteroidales bacterium]